MNFNRSYTTSCKLNLNLYYFAIVLPNNGSEKNDDDIYSKFSYVIALVSKGKQRNLLKEVIERGEFIYY